VPSVHRATQLCHIILSLEVFSVSFHDIHITFRSDFSLSSFWHPFHCLTGELVIFHSMYVAWPPLPISSQDFLHFAHSSSLSNFFICNSLFPCVPIFFQPLMMRSFQPLVICDCYVTLCHFHILRFLTQATRAT